MYFSGGGGGGELKKNQRTLATFGVPLMPLGENAFEAIGVLFDCFA